MRSDFSSAVVRTQRHRLDADKFPMFSVGWNWQGFCRDLDPCLKKNENAPRPSEYPPVSGEEMSKRLCGIKGCKYKTSS